MRRLCSSGTQLVSGPDFTRFRNRIRITPSGSTAPYAGAEIFHGRWRTPQVFGIPQVYGEKSPRTFLWTSDTFTRTADPPQWRTGI